MKFINFFAFFLFFGIVCVGQTHFADSHGPISVMWDHFHKENEVMLSYRFSSMEMNKSFNRTKNLNLKEIMNAPNRAPNNSGNYMNAHVYISMNMDMFGVTYAPRNTFILMLMLGLI